ncbi:hypothetical protein GFS31_34600 [Leptolyngbya sp. BL0902]|uniref:hypothetical protein n=1 Tax=Leptolyngbya sp. BL0902 TaxID=1115757 RepID=UPI00193801F3|nr:hypothetical protein [Leptolyngbya sp. BL0902]QQE66758.1 hypothetical protein GFS31_34600 [Leptolyngbya sp. BL0902]
MLLLILAIVIALVAWALRLMEQAVKGQEFSLMLAGFLVASSAAAMMAVYFLMGNYMVYLHQSPLSAAHLDYISTAFVDGDGTMAPLWLVEAD